jgi:NADH-quinone oxidoreductase subunit G
MESAESIVNFRGLFARATSRVPQRRTLTSPQLPFSTVTATAREIDSLGAWEGARTSFTPRAAVTSQAEMTLHSWRFLLDLGSLQQGEANLAGTAKEARAHISAATAAQLGVTENGSVVISSDRGSIELPVSIREIADNAIWVPRNSPGSQVIPSLGFTSGAVKVAKR